MDFIQPAIRPSDLGISLGGPALLGAVLGLQLVDGFRQFGAENQVGAVVGVAMAREIGPVFSALMVSSRAGSAMTTELGSMRVSDQINALVVMAVHPVQYLVVPRVVAGILMVPILTLFFNIIGLCGASLGLLTESLLYDLTGSHAEAISWIAATGFAAPLIVWRWFPETAGRPLEETAPEK